MTTRLPQRPPGGVWVRLCDLERDEVRRIGCEKCGRHGRYSIARLIDQHGPGTALTDLLSLLSADYPRAVAAQLTDWCGAQFTAGHRPPVLASNLIANMRAALQQREPLLMRERPFIGRVVEAGIAELEQIIFTTPARTMTGVRAKARARGMVYIIEATGPTPTGQQSASLITDIFALGSAA